MASTVIAVPVHNGGAYVEPALRSLLAQTSNDFALLLLDDASTDGSARIAQRLAEGNPRTCFFRNDRRIGMVENWRRCVELARELYPEARYFAWGSDHDLWEPGWLEALVRALDEEPKAVLACPLADRIDGDGTVVRATRAFETRGIETPARRLRRMSKGMAAGTTVYGLHRVDALVEAGVFRPVLAPDRLLLTELALRGEFVQVPRLLWHRRFAGLVSRERQRVSLFSGHPPWYTRLPPDLTHAGALLAVYVLRGGGRPEIGRIRSLGLTLVFASGAVGKTLRKKQRRIRRRRAQLAEDIRRRRKARHPRILKDQ